MLKMLAACLPTLALLSMPTLADEGPARAADLRTVSTTGEATVYVTPDEVLVKLGVETFGASLDDARVANDGVSAKLVKAILALGVEAKHLQTANLEVDVRYHERHQPDTGIDGYVARRAYSVTLKDVKRFEPLVEAALKNGANRLSGFEYRSTELRKHRDEARRLAIRAAKEKAAALAGELDCTLGTPRTITEGKFAGEAGFFGSNASVGQVAADLGGGDDGAGGQMTPPGRIAIHAAISTTFDLVPAPAEAAKPDAPAAPQASQAPAEAAR